MWVKSVEQEKGRRGLCQVRRRDGIQPMVITTSHDKNKPNHHWLRKRILPCRELYIPIMLSNRLL